VQATLDLSSRMVKLSPLWKIRLRPRMECWLTTRWSKSMVKIVSDSRYVLCLTISLKMCMKL